MTTKEEQLAALKAEMSDLLTRKSALIAQIDELEKEPEHKPLVIFDGWKPGMCDQYSAPDFVRDAPYGTYTFNNDTYDRMIAKRCLAFRTHEQAAAVADAFCVLMELRNQEGAGLVNVNGDGYVYEIYDGEFLYDYWCPLAKSFICPPFPSRELCERAVNNVGRERVERCLKLFAMVPL